MDKPEWVVVTGGAGFIGSHLVEALLDEGYRVRVVDNLATGHRANLAHLDGPLRLARGRRRRLRRLPEGRRGGRRTSSTRRRSPASRARSASRCSRTPAAPRPP